VRADFTVQLEPQPIALDPATAEAVGSAYGAALTTALQGAAVPPTSSARLTLLRVTPGGMRNVSAAAVAAAAAAPAGAAQRRQRVLQASPLSSDLAACDPTLVDDPAAPASAPCQLTSLAFAFAVTDTLAAASVNGTASGSSGGGGGDVTAPYVAYAAAAVRNMTAVHDAVTSLLLSAATAAPAGAGGAALTLDPAVAALAADVGGTATFAAVAPAVATATTVTAAAPTTGSGSGSAPLATGAIIGVAVGGVALAALAIAGAMLLVRRSRGGSGSARRAQRATELFRGPRASAIATVSGVSGKGLSGPHGGSSGGASGRDVVVVMGPASGRITRLNTGHSHAFLGAATTFNPSHAGAPAAVEGANPFHGSQAFAARAAAVRGSARNLTGAGSAEQQQLPGSRRGSRADVAPLGAELRGSVRGLQFANAGSARHLQYAASAGGGGSGGGLRLSVRMHSQANLAGSAGEDPQPPRSAVPSLPGGRPTSGSRRNLPLTRAAAGASYRNFGASAAAVRNPHRRSVVVSAGAGGDGGADGVAL